jgi:hypothetical protein
LIHQHCPPISVHLIYQSAAYAWNNATTHSLDDILDRHFEDTRTEDEDEDEAEAWQSVRASDEDAQLMPKISMAAVRTMKRRHVRRIGAFRRIAAPSSPRVTSQLRRRTMKQMSAILRTSLGASFADVEYQVMTTSTHLP